MFQLSAARLQSSKLLGLMAIAGLEQGTASAATALLKLRVQVGDGLLMSLNGLLKLRRSRFPQLRAQGRFIVSTLDLLF